MSAAAISTSSALVRCDYCNQEGPKSRCGRCQLVKYCGAECQKSAWKTHHQYMCVSKADPLNTKAYLSPSKGRPIAPVHYAGLFGKWGAMPREIQSTYSTATTKQGATPEDFYNLTSDRHVQEGVTTAYIDDRDDPLTYEEYRAMTGTQFRNSPKMTPQDVLKYYEYPPKQPLPKDLSTANPKNAAILERFTRNPPRIALVQESPVMGNGIRADEPIAEGEVVCSFGGEITTNPTKSTNNIHYHDLSEQNTMTLDLTRYTNLGAYVNDGPPNSTPAHIFHRGLPPAYVLTALCPIKKGEYFHWYYGGRHPVRITYSLTDAGETKVRSFCEKKMRTAQDFQSLKSLITDLEAPPPHDELFLDYLLGTPQVLMELVLKGIVDPKKLIPFLQSPEVQAHLQLNNPVLMGPAIYVKMMSQIEKICQNAELKAILLQQFAHLSYPALYFLVEDLSRVPLHEESMQGCSEKAKVFDVVIRFAYSKSPAPEGGWDRLLDTYAELPSSMKESTIPRYVTIPRYIKILASNADYMANYPENVATLNLLAEAFALEDRLSKGDLPPEVVAEQRAAVRAKLLAAREESKEGR